MKLQSALIVLNVALVASIACGGAPIPVAKVAQSQASIRAAEEAGAKQDPKAALHLQLARDQLSQGQSLINDGENERAQLSLDQARADAELALALAHEAREQSAVKAERARFEKLQSSTSSP